MTYTFTTKSEYLAATTRWKDDFRAHISAVRHAKRDIKVANRGLTRGTEMILYEAYRRLRALQQETNKMLTVRVSMRQESQRQYLARKQEFLQR